MPVCGTGRDPRNPRVQLSYFTNEAQRVSLSAQNQHERGRGGARPGAPAPLPQRRLSLSGPWSFSRPPDEGPPEMLAGALLLCQVCFCAWPPMQPFSRADRGEENETPARAGRAGVVAGLSAALHLVTTCFASSWSDALFGLSDESLGIFVGTGSQGQDRRGRRDTTGCLPSTPSPLLPP